MQSLDGWAVVVLPAEIDVNNAPAVSDTLLALLSQGAAGVVADMTGTRFCAAAGIHAVIDAHHHAQSLGAWVRIVISHRRVRRIFTLAGADHLVPLYPDLEAALPQPASPVADSRSGAADLPAPPPAFTHLGTHRAYSRQRPNAAPLVRKRPDPDPFVAEHDDGTGA